MDTVENGGFTSVRTTTDKPDKPFFSNNGINAVINCETTSSYHVPFDPTQSNRTINQYISFSTSCREEISFWEKGKNFDLHSKRMNYLDNEVSSVPPLHWNTPQQVTIQLSPRFGALEASKRFLFFFFFFPARELRPRFTLLNHEP